jgi:enoyl-CoA hydratase
LCDASANFRFPGANFGLVLGTRRLAQRVGVDTARRWVLESTAVDSGLATTSGLATACIGTLRPDPLPADGDPWLDGLVPSRIDAGTAAALRQASRADHSDADLAALVRSAARPGLVARIAQYRKSVTAG